MFSPAGSPGVLDDPVVLSRFSAVSDSEDTVVESTLGRFAILALVDSTEVELPPDAGSIDGNGDWLLSNSLLETVAIALSDISEFSVMVLTLVGLAAIGVSSVWVLRLRFETVLLGESETIVHETTIATLGGESMGLVAAVDELLLRDFWKSVALEEGGTLEGSSGRESPAGTALSLVLDSGDSTLSSPVN